MEAKKHILLVSANTFREPYPVFPLGVVYLKTYLDRKLDGFDLSIFDANTGSPDDLSRLIRKLKPSYVGMSLRNVDGANSLGNNDFAEDYRTLAAAVRRATDAPLIIGGSAFSIFPEKFMQLLDADYGIAGEGEESLRLLIETLDAGGDVSRIEGIVLSNDAGFSNNPHTCYISSPEIDFDSDLASYYWKFSGMLNIQTKRGCPYHCVYCSYPVIDGCRVRTLDAGQVVDNILRLRRDKNIDYFFFTDSVFNIADSYNVELAEALIAANADISWGAYFSPNNISREKMVLFAASGLTHVELGTEAMSDESLAAYGKHFTFDDVLSASEICLDLNIYYAHFLILGGYGETARTLEETIANSRRIRHSVFFPYVGMRIYPQTRLKDMAISEGVIAADDDLFVPKYYIAKDFDLDRARTMALGTSKAWIFPDDPPSPLMEKMRIVKNKKGPLWEYLRKP